MPAKILGRYDSVNQGTDQDVVSIGQVLERISDQHHCLAAQRSLNALLKQSTPHMGVDCRAR